MRERASSRSRTRSRASSPIARIHDAHDASADGRGDRLRLPGRRPARRAARPRQGGASSTSSTAPAGSSSTRARTSSATESHERLLSLDLGDLIGVDGTAFKTRRGELSLRVDDWQLLAKSLRAAAGEVPRPRGRRDALPPPRARPDRQRGGARAVHPALEGRLRDPPLARRARLPRGRDAGAAAALRRRARAAVHHAPQRARPGPLPAHRARALPEAADRRRPRAGLRDRQGLPQRGHLAQAQPRVHDARVVRGVRGLQRDRRRARGAASRSWRARSGYDGDDRPLAAVAARHAARRDPARRPASTCSSCRDRDALVAAAGRGLELDPTRRLAAARRRARCPSTSSRRS